MTAWDYLVTQVGYVSWYQPLLKDSKFLLYVWLSFLICLWLFFLHACHYLPDFCLFLRFVTKRLDVNLGGTQFSLELINLYQFNSQVEVHATECPYKTNRDISTNRIQV